MEKAFWASLAATLALCGCSEQSAAPITAEEALAESQYATNRAEDLAMRLDVMETELAAMERDLESARSDNEYLMRRVELLESGMSAANDNIIFLLGR